MPGQLPEMVEHRLPLYYREVVSLRQSRVQIVRSGELASRLGCTPEQVRKDFSLVGKLGQKGKGFSVEGLYFALRERLGLSRSWNALIFGLGRIGKAVVEYPGLSHAGFHIVAAFDSSPDLIDTKIRGLIIGHPNEMPAVVRDSQVDIGIVAVPAANAQHVIDDMIAANITGILNYAPITPTVPNNIVLESIDPVRRLQYMAGKISQLQL